MRRATRAITTLSALACALACGSGGGGGDTIVSLQSAFPQGFLPQLLAGSNGSGDVAFRSGGDLYAVGGDRADVTAISRTDGSVSTLASDVGGAGNSLLSIVAGVAPDDRLFAGDDQGRIWEIAANGAASLLVDTGSQPILGLAVAPSGLGDLAGSLFAAAGDGGILRIVLSDPPAVTIFTADTPATRYVDVGFSGTAMFALDAQGDKVDTVSALGVPTLLQGGFAAPVGMAVDNVLGEIYVADAGNDVMRTFPVAGGTVTDRAKYDFDSDAPSGVAHDGIGAIAFVTNAPFAVRGSALPRVDPNLSLVFAAPKAGFGDLEFDRIGAFVLTANDPDDPSVSGDSTNNYLLSVSRDGSTAGLLASGVGAAGEDLTGVAVDPRSEVVYFASRLGNVYQRLSDGTVSPPLSVSSAAVLGLELAPGLGPCTPNGAVFDGCLVATTSAGEVITIDPETNDFDVIAQIDGTSGLPARLSDLVFASDGTLFVLDNGQTTPTPGEPRILVVDANGNDSDLGIDADALERPDGIEIDEGAERLLIATDANGVDQLIAVALSDGDVTALGNIEVSEGFFPTGVVYDRLGTAVAHVGDTSTALDAVDVSP